MKNRDLADRLLRRHVTQTPRLGCAFGALAMVLNVSACGVSDAPAQSGLPQGVVAALDTDVGRAARQAEVDAHLLVHYFNRIRPVVTKAGPDGELVDWINPRDLDPLFDTRIVPSESAGAPAAGTDGQPGTLPPANTGTDIAARWRDPRYAGPAGTAPVIRPQYKTYVDGSSPAKSLAEFIANIPAPQPVGQQRLYAGRIENISNIGTQGWINYHSFGQVPSTGMSLGQQAVLCRGASQATTMEAIEIGAQINPGQYNGDTGLHWFGYFRTAGGAQGDYVGGYNTDFAGFVPNPGAFPLGATIPAPGAGGAERRFRTVLSGGVWWVQDWVSSSSFTWLGYYPIGATAPNINFDLINTAACEVHWYGEVFDPTETNWDDSNMGNGTLGTAGGSSYMREMIVDNATTTWFSTAAGSAAPADAACYAVSAVQSSGTAGWQRWLTWGGPGGDAAGCN